jgi:hypothetical protein
LGSNLSVTLSINKVSLSMEIGDKLTLSVIPYSPFSYDMY